MHSEAHSLDSLYSDSAEELMEPRLLWVQKEQEKAQDKYSKAAREAASPAFSARECSQEKLHHSVISSMTCVVISRSSLPSPCHSDSQYPRELSVGHALDLQSGILPHMCTWPQGSWKNSKGLPFPSLSSPPSEAGSFVVWVLGTSLHQRADWIVAISIDSDQGQSTGHNSNDYEVLFSLLLLQDRKLKAWLNAIDHWYELRDIGSFLSGCLIEARTFLITLLHSPKAISTP